jgi:hypothetical protein
MNILHFKKAALALIFCLSTIVLSAQISFTNQAELFNNQGFNSGVPMGVCDMNNDGLDDLIRLDNRDDLYIEFQESDGSFTSIFLDNYGDNDTWMVTAADVNNDGFNDLMTGGRYDGVKCYTRQEDGSYEKVTMPGASIFSQAANFADINNDGSLDMFVCHDDNTSRMWKNMGDGTYEMGDDLIDLSIYAGEDNSGNYGSVWSDFDNDGDLDLYIAKCRQGVNSSTDVRRINQLWINDGENNYSENAEEYGLKIGAQSWTADFGDYDNDGDFDCFITNHDVASQVLENDGTGHFTDVTASTGVNINDLPIQGMFHDFDNDGYLDIVVVGSDELMYQGHGDGTFTLVDNVFPGSSEMESYAIGDLNNDGFLDILGGYAQIFNNPTNIDDALWINEGNDHNWLKIKPTGVISNASGVGARIEITGDFGTQIREIRAGESYGITNSLKAHFGLGTFNTVTQVVIKWPSGLISVVENPDVNQTLEIIEGGCIAATPVIEVIGETILCPDSEPLVLTAPESAGYMWSNGATTQSIEVTEAGNYSVIITDAEDCFGISSSIIVTANPDATPTIELSSPNAFCIGGSVILTASEADSYLWSDGSTTQSIEINESDEYTVTVPGFCQMFTSEGYDLVLNIYMPDVPSSEDVTIFAPGTATLSADGDLPMWYDVPFGGTPLFSGNTFETPFLNETTPFYIENLQSFSAGNGNVGMEEHSGNSMYGGNNFNGGVVFDAYASFVLTSVRVYTDTPGPRTIELRDVNDVVLSSVVVNIPVGEHVIDLNLDIPVGNNLTLGTNTEANNDNFGFNSARLQRNNSNTNYPYVLDDVVSLNESTFGEDWFYYFYDWEIELAPAQCLSERIEVMAIVSTSSIIDFEGVNTLKLSPNPTHEMVYFELPSNVQREGIAQVYDIVGKQISSQKLTEESLQGIDLQGFANGTYFIKIISGKDTFGGRVVKQ